jgi:hypothetical protein
MAQQLAKRATDKWVAQVLEMFNNHTITEKEACELLGVKRIQLYEHRKRWLKSTIQNKKFKIRASGGVKKRSLPDKIQHFLHKELSYIKNDAVHYRSKFNFAYLSEKVHKQYGVTIHRNTIRRFAIEKGYYVQTSEEKQKPCIRFEMDSIGALYQHDTSHHVWLPCSKRYHDLIMSKDDHSRRVMNFSLRESESAWEHIRLARDTFEKFGVPLAYYVDRHSIFKFNIANKSVHYTRRISEEEGKVQFKRALNSVDVSVLYAQEARSKGKIEKQFDYFQRRLPVECERFKVKTIKEAMKILTDLVFYYNEKRIHHETGEIPLDRWKRAQNDKRSQLRPLPKDKDLDAIFSLHFERTVYPDGSFKFLSSTYKLKKRPGKKIIVAFIPDKKIMALFKDQKLFQYHFKGYR